MSPRNTSELLHTLRERTISNRFLTQQLAALDPPALHLRPRPDAWNAVDCFGHLNYYSDYYIPEMRKTIAAAKRDPQETYTSSWLGNKFAAGMKPGPKARQVSTPRGANPKNFSVAPDTTALQTFLDYQEETLELLDLARHVNLTKVKTGTSLSSLIRLRLCDTFRVVINHNWRHVEQARRACGLVE